MDDFIDDNILNRILTPAEADAMLPVSGYYEPTFLKEKWALRYGPPLTVKSFVRTLREGANSPLLDHESFGAEHTTKLVEVLVKLFERLIVNGAIDAELTKLSGLPLLFSPKAGVGAAKWTTAKNLFDSKSVGADGILAHRGVTPPLGASLWKHLAADAISTVELAVAFLAVVAKLPPAEFSFSAKKTRNGLRNSSSTRFYRLTDGEFVSWPGWLNACKGVAALSDGGHRIVPVREARGQYAEAVSVILEDFFADPQNQYANPMVERVLAGRPELDRSKGVGEIRKHVLKAVRSM